MRVFKSTLFVLFAILPLTLSAGGAHETAPRPVENTPMPAWVAQKPLDADGKSYFVASGASDTNDEAQANDAAAQDLINQINRYLGVTINSQSIATEVSTANEYQAMIVGVVKQTASGEVAGLRLADRYVNHGKNKVTVYLLGEYKTIDLEKEKAKRAALIKEAEDAVAVPEGKGSSAENAGQLFDAARSYLEAASAAANGQVRNSDVKFERNIQNTLRALSRLQIRKISGPSSIMARTPFDQDFIVAVSDIKSGEPVGSADIAVGYREYQDNGKYRMKTQVIKTDNTGMAKIRLPDPIVVGTEKVSFALDLSAYVRSVDQLAGKEKSLVDSVLDAAVGKRVSFDFSVQSAARNASMAALVLELDANGDQMEDIKVGQGIQQQLSAAGFRLVSIAVSANFLVGKSDQEIHLLLKDVAANKADRIAYGTARITGFDDRGSDGIIAKASANMTVIDIKSGAILLSFTLASNGLGSNSSSAINAVLGKLGSDIGAKLTRDLP